MTRVVYRADGGRVDLGAELGRGGEGAVYGLPGNDLDCAKVYHQPLSPEGARKLHLMVENAPHDPAFDTLKHRSIAWPSATLFADAGRATCIGFVMPRVDMRAFKKALLYFNAVDRNRLWGCSFTWKHLYTAAFNVASAVAAIHERGYCIGDLNESNTLIAFNTLVTIIDCDSFQVPDPDAGRAYRCPVGKGEYTAPELQGKSYRDVDRTLETDRFALAVFLFQLLMDGTHPYQARGPLVDGAPTTEAKIIRGYFPYASRAPGVEPPQFALPYDVLPPELQRLFERAFVSGHGNPRIRPAAGDWFESLIRLRGQFVQCRGQGTHLYLNHRGTCPWCELKRERGKDLFPTPFGQQIPMEDATVALETVERRLDYLRSYVTVALADGLLNPEEKSYLTALGARLQISPKDIDRVIREEARRQRVEVARPAPGAAARTVPVWAPSTGPVVLADFQQKATYLGVVVGTLGGLLADALLPDAWSRAMATVAAVLALVGALVVVARAYRSPAGAVLGSLGTVVLFSLLRGTAPVVLAAPSWGVVFGALLFLRARRLYPIYQASPATALGAAAREALTLGFALVFIGGLAATAATPVGFAPRPIATAPPLSQPPASSPPVEQPDSAALGELRRGVARGRALFDQGRYAEASAAFRDVERESRALAARYPDDLELQQLGTEGRRWLAKVRDACQAERDVALRRGAAPPVCS